MEKPEQRIEWRNVAINGGFEPFNISFHIPLFCFWKSEIKHIYNSIFLYRVSQLNLPRSGGRGGGLAFFLFF